MPSLVVPQAGQLRLIWTLSGQPTAVNVLGFHNPNAVAINQTLANTIGAAAKTGFTNSGMAALVGTSFALASVGLRDLNTANRAEVTDTGAAVPGTGAGDLLPPQTALVVTLRTALAGRSYRGRVFLPGWLEAANGATGAATSAATAAAVSFMGSIVNSMGSAGIPVAIVSRPAPDAVPPRPVGFVTPVTAYVTRDAVWDTQRRRTRPGI